MDGAEAGTRLATRERDLGYGLCAVGAVTACLSQDFLRTALLLCCATNRSKPLNFWTFLSYRQRRVLGFLMIVLGFILFYLLNVAMPKYIF